MKDLARVGNHPIHPMIVPLPIGLWIFSLAADIIYRVYGNEIWASVAYYSMAGGIVGALLAAVPGFVDFYALKPGAVKKIALWHMLINLSAVVLFSVNFYLRTGAPDAAVPLILSIVGVGSILVSGWLGLPKEMSNAFLIGFLRRDFGAVYILDASTGPDPLLAPLQIFVSMVTITLFMPCIANFLMIGKEHGMKVAWAMAAFIFPFAFFVGGLINHLGLWLNLF